MKHKNLLLMALAMLLMVPMQMSAKKGMGWLHFGESGDAYYNESGTTVSVKYNGTTYQAYPVVGYSNVYYVPNEKTFGTKNENLKILYLKGASLTKNIRCTKSTTNLVVVVSGTNSISFGGGSNFKMETGNLTIVGANGPSTDKLTVTQTGKYKGAYTTNGSMTIKDVTLTVNTKSADALSQELSSGKLTVNNANVTTNHAVYAKGGVSLIDAAYAVSGAKVNSKYYIGNASGTTLVSVVINATKKPATQTQTTAQKIAAMFDDSQGNIAISLPYGWKILGKNAFKCKKQNIKVGNDTYNAHVIPYKVDRSYIYYVAEKNMIVLSGTGYYNAVDDVPFIDMPSGSHSASVHLTVHFAPANPAHRGEVSSSSKANFIRSNQGYLTIEGEGFDQYKDYQNFNQNGYPLISTKSRLNIKNISMFFKGSSTSNPNISGSKGSLTVTNSSLEHLFPDGITSMTTTNCGLDKTGSYGNLSLNCTTGKFSGMPSSGLHITNSAGYVTVNTSSRTGSVWKFK